MVNSIRWAETKVTCYSCGLTVTPKTVYVWRHTAKESVTVPTPVCPECQASYIV